MRRECPPTTLRAWHRIIRTFILFSLTCLASAHGAEVDGIKFLGDERDRNVGIFVGGNGDLNADGVDDILVAAWKTSRDSSGRVYVIYGGQPIDPDFRLGDLLDGDGSRGVVLSPDPARDRDRFGRSADFLEDVNGDGIDDIIVGSIYSGRSGEGDLPYDAGEAYVVFGRAGGLPAEFNVGDLFQANGGDGSEGFVIRGFRRQDELGRSVSRAGDLNGDGIADLVVGALVDTYIYDDPTPGEGPGEAYVIFGRADGSFAPEIDLETLVNEGDGSDGFVLRGVKNLDRMGIVAEAGDVDGDGVDDLILGAISGGVAVSGETYVVYGRSNGFPGIFELSSLLPANGGDGSQGFVVLGSQPGDRLGLVHGAGDVNGDGFDDVLMGAYRAAPLGIAETGVVYLVLGQARNQRGPAFDLRSLFPDNGGDGSRGSVIPGSDAGDRLASVSAAGNVNADGFDDFLVGSFRGEEGQGTPDGDVGEAYLIFGRAAFPAIFFLDRLRAEEGADGTSGAVIIGEDADGRQGRAVSEAGDVDADGYDDVITGAWQADGEDNGLNANDAGEAYLTFGREGLVPPSLRVSVYDDPFPNPLAGACAGLTATLYDDDDFTEVLATLSVGVYDKLAADIDDRISAVAIAPGLRVSLYRDVGELDQPDLVLDEDAVLTGADDDEVSAVLVQCQDPSGAPTVINPGEQRNTAGDLADLMIEVVGDAGAPYTYAARGLPPVLVIAPGSGHISGLITTPGEYAVQVDVTSFYGGISTVDFDWIVGDAQNNVPPNLVDPGDQISVVGTSVALQLQGSDADDDPLSYSAAPLPDGLAIDPQTGLISGTPTREQSVSVIASVEDGRGGSASVAFEWTVNSEPNVAPTLDNPGPQTGTEGDVVSLQLIASDEDDDTLTYAAQGLPAGLSVDPATGLISGALTQAQTTQVTASVDDGRGGSASVQFTWTVEARNVAPTLENPGTQTNTEGDVVSLQLVASDADDDSLTFAAEGLPTGLALTPATGLITGVPSQVQSTTVIASVDDGRGGVASVSFLWIVEERNVAPTLENPGDQRTVEGTSVSLALIASDANGDPLRFSASGLPAGLELDELSGVISGIPVQPQTSSVLATVDDGRGGSASVSFTWVVEEINLAPTLENPGAQETIAGTPVSLQLVADDANGDPLSFSAQGLPAGLAIDGNSGLISGTPTTEQVREVVARVEDGRGGAASVSFTWTVGGGSFEERLETAPFTLPASGGSATQQVDLTALGVAPGDLVRVTDVRALGDIDASSETFRLDFNDGGPLSLALATGQECSDRLDGVQPEVAVWVSVTTIDNGAPGIIVEGTTSSSVGGFCDPVDGGGDVALQYVLVVERGGPAIRSAVRELPEDGGSATHVVDLSSLGIAVGDSVQISDVRAQGDLDSSREVFALSFNNGADQVDDLTVVEECAARLDPVVTPVASTVRAIDLGDGTPGLNVTGTTDDSVGGFCDPVHSGGDVAVQYTLVAAPTDALKSKITELPDDGDSTTFNIDLSGLGVSVGERVSIVRVRARGDLDSGSENFDLSFNSGELRFDALTVIGECVGLEPVTADVQGTVTVTDIGGGTPGVVVTGTTSGAVDQRCTPRGQSDDDDDDDDENGDTIAVQLDIELRRQ